MLFENATPQRPRPLGFGCDDHDNDNDPTGAFPVCHYASPVIAGMQMFIALGGNGRPHVYSEPGQASMTAAQLAVWLGAVTVLAARVPAA